MCTTNHREVAARSTELISCPPAASALRLRLTEVGSVDLHKIKPDWQNLKPAQPFSLVAAVIILFFIIHSIMFPPERL